MSETLTDLLKLIPPEPPLYEGGCVWKRRANRKRITEWEASCRDLPSAPVALRNPGIAKKRDGWYRNSLRYTGVRYLTAAGMWEAWYSIGPHRTVVGRFADETEAAEARERAIVAVGCTATRNFTDENREGQ